MSRRRDLIPIVKYLLIFIFIMCTHYAAMVKVYATGFEYKRVCYYNNQAQSRPGAGMCAPESLDPTLCTHLIYAYATMVDNKLKASLATDESTLEKIGM